MIAVALALGAAGAYASRQRHVYESTATLYVHPSQALISQGSPAVISDELGVLSYGSLVNTFLSIAQSRSMLTAAASTLRIPPGQLSRYTAIAAVRPKSFVMDVSVDGPDRRVVVALANGLSAGVGRTVSARFPVVALSSLGGASTSTEVQPRLKRDLVYGGLAGLIIGIVLAAVTLPAVRSSESWDPEGSSPSPVEETAEEPPIDEHRADSELPAGGAA